MYTGKIVIKSKNNQYKVTIPYRAHVLTGKLAVDEKITQFHLKTNATTTKMMAMRKNFTVVNKFKVAVAINDLSASSETLKYFRFKDFKPSLIGPGESKDLFVISLTKEAWEKKILDSWITLHTNISTMNIPVVVFHGMVDKFLPGSPTQNLIDFGTLGMDEKRDAYFTILNRNPVTLNLVDWGPNYTGTLLEMMGVEKGAEPEIMQRSNFTGMRRSLQIPPFHFMVFRLGISTPGEEGETNSTVFVKTDYETINIPFKFRVARGSLATVPSELIFEPAFPVRKKIDLCSLNVLSISNQPFFTGEESGSEIASLFELSRGDDHGFRERQTPRQPVQFPARSVGRPDSHHVI